jgi:hypothetical protein
VPASGVVGQYLSRGLLCTLSCHAILHPLPCVPSAPLSTSCSTEWVPCLDALGYYLRTPSPGVNQSSATHAQHRPREDSCQFQARRDRLRSRAARISPRCHPADSEHSARRGRHSRGGQHKLRWATAPPNPATGSRNPKRGFGRGARRPVLAVALPLAGVHRWHHRRPLRLPLPPIHASTASDQSTPVSAPVSAR